MDSLDVNDIHVNVSLQMSRCNFVHGEILQMHTIHESNYTVIKLLRNGRSKAKNLLSSTTNGLDALDYFYTDQSFVGWYKTTPDEGHS